MKRPVQPTQPRRPSRGVPIGVTSLALAAVTLTTVSASAQTPPAEPTKEQLQMYATASKAFAEGDYQATIEILNNAVAISKVNIFYANLGRALFRVGRCEEARAAYGEALVVPAVAEPAPKLVAAKVAEYQAELMAECPGSVVVTCEPATMSVSIDGESKGTCSGEAVELAPGFHVVEVKDADGRTSAAAVNVVAMQSSTVSLAVAKPGAIMERDRWDTAGMTMGIAGLALVAGGAAVDFTVAKKAADDRDKAPLDKEKRDQANLFKGLAIGGYAAGGIMLVTGAVFAFILPDAPATDEASELTFSPWVTGDHVGARWNLAF